MDIASATDAVRYAALPISVECLAEVRVLTDSGLEIVGSLDSGAEDIVVLVVRGRNLPAACPTTYNPGEMPFLTVVLSKEAYGSQSITRVSEITASERRVADSCPMYRRAA